MKTKRNAAACLLAIMTTLSLVMTGCMGPMVFPSASAPATAPTSELPVTTERPAPTQPSLSSEPTEAPTVYTEPTEAPTKPTSTTEAPIDPNDEALIRWRNGGRRDYLPDEPVAMVPFSEMEYVRPDVESIYADFDALTERAKDSDDAQSLLSDFYNLYDRYVGFYSMNSLSNILHSLDTTESYYQDEYNYCEEESPNLEEKLEALYKAFAASPSRNELETLYFGSGFFEKYDDYEVYTNPEYLRLSQEEAALLSEYRELTADMQVTYQNETKPLEEWLETQDYTVYIGALQAYYDQYNASVGDVFVRLVKVRQQLAAALGYDSYAEYSYEMTYSRDYTPEEGDAFLADIRTYMIPVLEEANSDYSIARLNAGTATEGELRAMLRSAAERIGGTVWDAYRFMMAYELCDITQSSKKLEASYQTYLYDYESPFVFLNSSGSSRDYTTFSHEFGHFTDSYYNYGADEDLETAETFSQAMEFLALTYSETISEQQRQTLIKMNLYDTLQTFVYQAAYADFEARVYALDPNEITLEKINETFLQCCKDYGVYEFGFDFYYSQSWIDVLHFFEVPYYIISYCVSAETALQVYRLEAENEGAGVAAYFRLLDRSYDAGVQQVMEDAKLESPFAEGVLAGTAAFIEESLGLN